MLLLGWLLQHSWVVKLLSGVYLNHTNEVGLAVFLNGDEMWGLPATLCFWQSVSLLLWL